MGKIKEPHHFYDPIYKENFYFLYIWKPEDVRKECWSGFYPDEHCNGKCFETKQGIFIWIRNRYDYGTLVHESVHACNFFLKAKGVRVTRHNDEALCYHVQWVFENCMEVI